MTKTKSILNLCHQAGLTQWLHGILTITRTSSTFFLPFFKLLLSFFVSHTSAAFSQFDFSVLFPSAAQLIPFPKDFYVFDDIKSR